jgi:hypothetical protein
MESRTLEKSESRKFRKFRIQKIQKSQNSIYIYIYLNIYNSENSEIQNSDKIRK